MKITPTTLINTVVATVLLSSLLFIAATAQTSPYDPWYDFDDDGDIDIFDTVDFAGRYGTTGTPINKTELLLELQSRLDAVEARLDQSRWIRFYQPNETFHYETATWKNAASFVWTPENASNAAMVSIVYYYQYKNEGAVPKIEDRLLINGEEALVYGWHYTSVEYTWTEVKRTSNWNNENFPNKDSYNITVQILPGLDTTSYVKDVTILLEVCDGLPHE